MQYTLHNKTYITQMDHLGGHNRRNCLRALIQKKKKKKTLLLTVEATTSSSWVNIACFILVLINILSHLIKMKIKKYFKKIIFLRCCKYYISNDNYK